MRLDRRKGIDHSCLMGSEDGVFVRVEIRALVVDPTTEAPVVILQAEESQELLPIWIGGFEAQAIALAVGKIQPPRPLTHDLLKSVIDQTGFEVISVRIRDLVDGVFKASLNLSAQGGASQTLEIDARPSDAIALAVRTGVAVEVSQAVLNLASVRTQSVDEAIKHLLEQLKPEDLGEYEM